MTDVYCGCCSARSGTLTVGILSFILSISLTIIVIDSIIFDSDGIHAGLESEYLIIGVVNIITSCCCIIGASRDSRQLLLPWLFITALVMLSIFFAAMYFILFQFYEWVLLGVILFILTGGIFYGWMCVAAFYTELREKEIAEEEVRRSRSFLSPEAVTRPEGFAFPPPPPPYTIAYENPAMLHDKPPTYEEVANAYKEQTRIGRV